MNSTRRGTVAAVALAAALLGALAGPASAHTQIVDTAPEDGASVTEPFSAVVLRFDHPPVEPVAETTEVAVTSPGGQDVSAGITAGAAQQLAEPIPVLVQQDGEWVTDYHFDAYPLQVAVSALPETGSYTVSYTVPDADGHATEGSFSFTYAGPTGPVPDDADHAPGPATAAGPAAAEQAGAVSPAPAADGAAADTSPASAMAPSEEAGTPGWLLPLAALAALAIVAGAVAFVRSRPQERASAAPRLAARDSHSKRRRAAAVPRSAARRSPSSGRPRR